MHKQETDFYFLLHKMLEKKEERNRLIGVIILYFIYKLLGVTKLNYVKSIHEQCKSILRYSKSPIIRGIGWQRDHE